MSDLNQSVGKTLESGAVPDDRQPRQPTWICRLPSELMARVCEILVKDICQYTLSKLRVTSSAMYTLVTPYLYQHLHLDQFTAVSFFDLFQKFPLSDNRRFFYPVPPNIHLIDMHPADRLQAVLSNTTTLTLTFRDKSLDHLPPTYIKGLERYKDLVIGLSTFEGPTLWPSLRRCVIDAGTESDQQRQYHYLLMRPDFYRIFIKAIFTKLHPAEISIRFPDYRRPWGGEYPSPWDSIMQRISAKHIDFIDYIPGADIGIPRAASSLTLRIHQIAMSRDTRSVGRSIRNIFNQHQSIVDIRCLKLVGLILIPATRIDITLVVFGYIAKHIRKTMIARLHHGNTADLRVGLLADTSPEGEAAAVWRTYNAPREH